MFKAGTYVVDTGYYAGIIQSMSVADIPFTDQALQLCNYEQESSQ